MQTRWRQLFSDLEAQAAAAEAAELAHEVSDRTRGELARLAMASRLRASVGRSVDLRMQGGSRVVGIVGFLGADWALIATPAETVVMLDAIAVAVDLSPVAVGESAVRTAALRVGMGPMWRAVARDRTPVRIGLRDGSVITGTPDRVGSDFVDVAIHDFDETPRARDVKARWTVAWRASAVVTRREPSIEKY